MTEFYMRLSPPESEYQKHSLVTLRGFRSSTLNIYAQNAGVQESGPFMGVDMRGVECKKCRTLVGWYFHTPNIFGTEWLRERMAINLRKSTAFTARGNLVRIIKYLSHVMNSTHEVEFTPRQEVVQMYRHHDNALEAYRELKREMEKLPDEKRLMKEKLAKVLKACDGMDTMFNVLNGKRVEFKDSCVRLREAYEFQNERIKKLLLEKRRRTGTVVGKDRPCSKSILARNQDKSHFTQAREESSLIPMAKQFTPSTLPTSMPLTASAQKTTGEPPMRTPVERILSRSSRGQRGQRFH